MKKPKLWVWPMLGTLVLTLAGILHWFVYQDGEPGIGVILSSIALLLFGMAVSNGFKLGFFESD